MINTDTTTQHLPVHLTSATEALYDLSMLEEMEDDDYLMEMIDLFLTETPVEIKELNSAFTNNNADGIYKKAHKLKSNAGIIQAQKMLRLLSEIEMLAKKGSTETAKDLIEEINHQYYHIEQALQKQLKQRA